MANGNLCNCIDCVVGWECFNVLTDEQRAFLNDNRFEATFKPGENIFKQGSPASSAVFLSAGLAKVYMEGQGSKNFLLSVAKPGQMIIGPGIYTNSRHIFSVTALNDVRACFIETKFIKDMVKENSDFAESLLKDVSYKAQRNI